MLQRRKLGDSFSLLMWIIIVFGFVLMCVGIACSIKQDLILRAQETECSLVNCWLTSDGYYCRFAYVDHTTYAGQVCITANNCRALLPPPGIGIDAPILRNLSSAIVMGKLEVVQMRPVASDNSIDHYWTGEGLVNPTVYEYKYGNVSACFVDPLNKEDIYLDMRAQQQAKDQLLVAIIVMSCLTGVPMIAVISMILYKEYHRR